MNYFGSLKTRLLAGVGFAVIGAATCSVRIPMVYAGPQAAPEKPPVTSTLSGAELYAISCSRCHQERYPTEFDPARWKTIMTHMRVRANLPAVQAREILKYLQEEAGS
jgi:mono/diheme cytochrome c family protein